MIRKIISHRVHARTLYRQEPTRTRHTFAAILIAALIGAGPAFAKPAKVGEPAPDFTGTTLDNKEVSFAALKGNVIIVNFWATWCPPCREELPVLSAYAKAREKYGLKVLAVTMDARQVKKDFLEKLQGELGFPLLDQFKGSEYRLIKRAIPTSYIIDREGIVRYAEARPFTLDDLNRELVPLLNMPTPAKAAAE